MYAPVPDTLLLEMSSVPLTFFVAYVMNDVDFYVISSYGYLYPSIRFAATPRTASEVEGASTCSNEASDLDFDRRSTRIKKARRKCKI